MKKEITPDQLSSAYEAARQETHFHAKSFYFSSFALPATKRQRAYAVYALCRLIDDQIDEAAPGDDLVHAVADLRALVDRLYAGQLTEADQADYPWLPAVDETIRECEIPRQYIDDLIEGVELDQGPVRLKTWAELDRYCYLVAGVVGLIMTRIFGLEDREYEKQAIELGNAMQLTNILRDIAEDLERDRIYLPEEELAGYVLRKKTYAVARSLRSGANLWSSRSSARVSITGIVSPALNTCRRMDHNELYG